MLAVQLGVRKRQLDRVADLLDLRPQATDVGVPDVGHLLEDQLLDLRTGHALEHEPAARLHREGVTDAQRLVAQRAGEAHDALLVRPADDQRPVVADELLDRHDLADGLVAARLDERERLVELDLLARAQGVQVDGGRDLHVHLATLGDDLGRAVGPPGQEGRERGGWPAQVLQPVLELHDLVARLAQRVRQALVLRGEGGGLPGGLGSLTCRVRLGVGVHDRLRSLGTYV